MAQLTHSGHSSSGTHRRGRLWLFLLASSVFLTPALAVSNDDGDLQASRSAIKQFAAALQGELQTAMQSGGPQKAISVCHSRAPEIAESLSEVQGLEIRRTSLKVRNPENYPEPWQKEVLQQFEQRLAAGESAQEIEHFETLDGDDFRYMKAIPTGELCLICHGKNVSSEVKQSLDELYPEDVATGYELGAIRGAFVVTRP